MCTGREQKKWRQVGGKERERERKEGKKKRVKEKVVKLEGWGERANTRREKHRTVDREKMELYREMKERVGRDGEMSRGEKKSKIHFLCRYKDLSREREHAATAQDPPYAHYD